MTTLPEVDNYLLHLAAIEGTVVILTISVTAAVTSATVLPLHTIALPVVKSNLRKSLKIDHLDLC